MSIIEDVIRFIKDLLKGFRGGKPKPSRKEILQRHNRNFETSAPKKIYSPPVEDAVDVEKNIPVETPQKKIPDKFVIDIKDNLDFENFLAKLKNLRAFDEFLEETPLEWANVGLDRVRGALKKIPPNPDFTDDELNFKLAKRTREVTEHMLKIFQDSIVSRDLNENSRTKLKNLVEEYLDSVGVDKEIFNAGDSFDSWAKLGMTNSFLAIRTDNPDLGNKLVEVEIQPRVIYYVGETGNVDKLTFGGMCKVYKFVKPES